MIGLKDPHANSVHLAIFVHVFVLIKNCDPNDNEVVAVYDD